MGFRLGAVPSGTNALAFMLDVYTGASNVSWNRRVTAIKLYYKFSDGPDWFEVQYFDVNKAWKESDKIFDTENTGYWIPILSSLAKSGTTDGSGGHLVTLRRWSNLGTPVAAAFARQWQRVVFEALLKLAGLHRSGTFARFSLNADLPGQRIDIPGHWRHTIVADKQSCRRRYRVIKQVSGCLCVYGPVVENDQTRFTRYRKKLVTLRQRRGYQATGHVFCERDTRPEHRAHHRKT